MKMPPNKSPEPTAVGACSLRSQRRHGLVARQETFAARTVVTLDITSPAWLSFLR